jgi:hypothetical protein
MLRLIVALALLTAAGTASADDRELRDLPISGWPCLQQPSGTAKTPDGIERNAMKNRGVERFEHQKIDGFDFPGFLSHVAAYDSQLRARRRPELDPPRKTLLGGFENQLVSLTGYLVLAYSGPPETCNCGDRQHHDWHLELFERSSDHHPQPGDATPLICEITPRAEQALYRSGVRLQELAGFIRNRKEYEPTNHPPQLVRVTGYLMWDDEHNGTADVGDTVTYITPGNGFHHPWRATAWEIHPVIDVQRVASPDRPTTGEAPTPVTAASAPTTPSVITLTRPVSLKIPYGETTLPIGAKLELVSRASDSLTVRYMGADYVIPTAATGIAP